MMSRTFDANGSILYLAFKISKSINLPFRPRTVKPDPFWANCAANRVQLTTEADSDRWGADRELELIFSPGKH